MDGDEFMVIKKTSPNLLQLVEYEHSLLHNPVETVEFPLSESDKQLIEDMKHSILADQLKKAGAPWESASGMAANQWGHNKRIFIYCPVVRPEEFLEVIINPSYEPIADPTTGQFLQDERWEACFSVPLSTGLVKRFTHIRATYQNELGETKTKDLKDYEARVWQHENDHLNGFLYEDKRTGKCIVNETFPTLAALEEFFDNLRKVPKG